MKKLKSHFRFNKQERSGIFFLLCIIFILQLFDFAWRKINHGSNYENFRIDSQSQKLLDSFLANEPKMKKSNFRPFNPNYLSDFKAYLIGLDPDEIDRLQAYRDSGFFINSLSQFQQVTRISDSLMTELIPLIQFPKRTKNYNKHIQKNTKGNRYIVREFAENKRDLNSVTTEELMAIDGIGPVLSQRILKFRNALGGFLVDDQIYDVYGLDNEVAALVLKEFTVLDKPEVIPLSINEATIGELAKLVYISKDLAQEIIHYRDSLGAINSLDELTKFQDLPSDKINRIKLYLTL